MGCAEICVTGTPSTTVTIRYLPGGTRNRTKRSMNRSAATPQAWMYVWGVYAPPAAQARPGSRADQDQESVAVRALVVFSVRALQVRGRGTQATLLAIRLAMTRS